MESKRVVGVKGLQNGLQPTGSRLGTKENGGGPVEGLLDQATTGGTTPVLLRTEMCGRKKEKKSDYPGAGRGGLPAKKKDHQTRRELAERQKVPEGGA